MIKDETKAIFDLVGIIVISQPYKTILTLRYLQELNEDKETAEAFFAEYLKELYNN